MYIAGMYTCRPKMLSQLLLVTLLTSSFKLTQARHCHSAINGTVRLVGGSGTLEGRVELCVNGAWSTVCDNGWYGSEGRVVCRQLGCSHDSSYGVYHNAYYGRGSGDIAYVSCGGSEGSLLSCPTVIYNYQGCGHYEDVGVRCIRDVSVPVRPAAVTGISVRNIASTSLTISYSEAQPSTTVCSTTQMCARAVCTARSSLTYEVYCTVTATGRRDYRRTATYGTSITATGLSSNTRYRCCVIARNSVGVAGASCINTQTLEPPDMPRNLYISRITSTSVTLQWRSPLTSSNRDQVGHYRITYGSSPRTTQSTSYSARNLRPYTMYRFCVSAVAVNSGGEGPSTCISRTTQEAAPSRSPASLVVTSETPTSLTLAWTPPLSQYRNGVIRRYTVRVCDSQQGAASCITQQTSSTTRTIGGLLPYIEYDVSVAAYTVGLGPYRTLYRQTTEQNPPTGAPEGVTCNSTSPTSLHISWSPPPLEHQNGVIGWYRVTITNTSTGNTAVNTTTTSLSKAVYNLHPHYNYTCSVAAYTVGMGQYGNTTVQMPEDVPRASPRSLTLEPSDPTTLVVSWTPPPIERQNGVIRRYTVKVCRNQQCTEHNATGLTQRVGGLHPHYTYDVSVAAYTVGLGPFTTERRIQMPEDVPSSPPRYVTCTPSSPTSLYVSWSQPPLEHHNGVIRWYNILITNTSTGNTAVNTTSSSLSVTLNDLHPHYNYTCSVAAYTVGMGPYGNTTVQMPEDAPSGPPQDLTSNTLSLTSARLSWSPPEVIKQNGVIRGYHIVLHNATMRRHYNANSTTLTVPQLTSNSMYFWSVAAYTEVGTGPYSNETTLELDQYSPLEIGLYSTAGVMTLLAFTIGIPVCVGVACFYRTNPSKILRKQKRQTDKDKHTDRAPVSNKYADRSKWQRKLTTLQVLKKFHKKSVNGKQDGVVAESTCDAPAPKVPQRRYLEDVDFVAGNFDMILTGNPELPDRRYLEDIDFVTGDFDLFFKSRESAGDVANQGPLEENDAAASDLNTEEDKAQEYEQAIEMRDLSANERGVPSQEADANRIYQPLSSTTRQAETSQYASLHTIQKDGGHYVNISTVKDKPQLPPPQNNSSTGHYQPLLLSRELTQPDAEYSDPRTLHPSCGTQGRETERKAGAERKTLRDVKQKVQRSKEKERRE